MKIYWDEAEKVRQLERKVQLEETNQKVVVKEGRLKRYRDRTKQYRQNRTFQNSERKFYQPVSGEQAKTYQQLDEKEEKRFWSKIWERKDHNKKAEYINNMETELRILEEGPKVEIHLEYPRQHLNNTKLENPLA